MTETSKTNSKKYKVLIVDDDKFLLNMYSMKFAKAGMDITVISDPSEAYDKIKGGLSPDVLLVDIVMPVMDGLELLTKIKKENLLPKTIFIILSNQGQQEDIDKAKKIGVHGYIIKATTIPSEVITQMCKIAEENGK